MQNRSTQLYNITLTHLTQTFNARHYSPAVDLVDGNSADEEVKDVADLQCEVEMGGDYERILIGRNCTGL